MKKINCVIQQSNPNAELYKNMPAGEQEVERARRDNVPIRTFESRFRRWSDVRHYNFVTSNEKVAVFVGENGAPLEIRDIIEYPIDVPPPKLSYTSCHLNPMIYPIPFIPEEFGWHYEMQQVIKYRTRVLNRLIMQQYCSYRFEFMVGFSVIHRAVKLFQKYLVDAYVNVEVCNI
ncbi:Hypothetical predicted protein [Octopus vulgaris]|uniref:Uncharacterized protein n=1 Tax=Octopus vulgaris TaxID=6645 RepID=A0AA36BAY2_OCTVU|nr:Hypothetical predicted protein [Octopus vulgaris]